MLDILHTGLNSTLRDAYILGQARRMFDGLAENDLLDRTDTRPENEAECQKCIEEALALPVDY